jgi:hypothetical protein
MSNEVRNVFILAGMLAVYGFALWLYESKALNTWADGFALNPQARFQALRRDDMIREEFEPTEEPADAPD